MEEERESSGQTLTSRVVQQGVQSVSTIQINKKIIIPINLDKKKFEKILRIKNSGNSLE
jgi:hypothetical protein